MMERWNILAVCLPAIFLSLVIHAADIKMDVTANRNNIFIGESVQLTVKVSGLDSPQVLPDLSALSNCKVRLLGSNSDSHYSIVIVNGKITKDGFSGRVFTYELTPSSTGTFNAGPINIAVNGQIIKAEGPSIQVTGIEKQEWVDISIKASSESVLVDEPFDITLSISLKRLPHQYAEIDPLDPRDPPTLSVPFLENNPISGLEMPNIEKILNDHFVNRGDAPGFAINNYNVRNDPMDIMNMFNFRNQVAKAKFIFNKKINSKNGISYFQYTLIMTYTPKEENNHTFGPVIFKGPVITGVNQDSHGISTNIFAVGPAVTVRVIPPPEEGRPASYVGAIGSNIIAEASLDTQTCKVGDPLKLTLEISGNIRIDNINPPVLNIQTNLTRHFKIYEDTVQSSSKDGKKVFVYTVRPTTAGTLELPPIEISYFDSISRAYRKIYTQPIPVRANESLEIGAANIIETVTNRTSEVKKTTEQDSFIIAPIDINPAGAIPDQIALKPWEIVTLTASPFIYFLVAGITLIRKRRKIGEGARRRNRGINEVFTLLRDCKSLSETNSANARIVLCTAIRKYIANRFGAIEAGLTPSDARELLKNSGIDPVIGNNLCDILERNFNATYSSHAIVSVNITDDCKQADSIIHQMENTFKSSSLTRSKRTLLLSFSISAILSTITLATENTFISPAQSTSDNPVEFQFLWNEANSKISSAASPEDFAAAAAIYRKLTDIGVHNGIVFYNMGTALLKARQYNEAILSLQRAERYSGSNEDLRHNMLLAIAGKEKNPNVSLPWYRVPLFWHYNLAIATRIVLTVCAFAVFWFAFLIRNLGSTRIYKPLMSVALILLIVFGSSTATSIHQEETDSLSYPRIIYDSKQPSQTGRVETTNTLSTVHQGEK
jgi:hypothetical protein